MDGRRLSTGAGGHDSAGRFPLRSLRASAGHPFWAGGLRHRFAARGQRGLAGHADRRARGPRARCGVLGPRVPRFDQFHVRPRRPSRGHRVLDRVDRYRVRARPAAGRLGRGLSQLAMGLCPVGGPDGHRFRVDVLVAPRAVPGFKAHAPCPPRRCRGRLVGRRAGRHRVCPHRIEEPRMGRSPRRHVAGCRRRHTAGVRGLAVPRRTPVSAAQPLLDPQLRGPGSS